MGRIQRCEHTHCYVLFNSEECPICQVICERDDLKKEVEALSQRLNAEVSGKIYPVDHASLTVDERKQT